MKKKFFELEDDYVFGSEKVSRMKTDTFICCGMIFSPTGPFLSKEIREIGDVIKIFGRTFDECFQTMSELADGIGIPAASFSRRYGFATANGDIIVDKRRAYKMAVADGIENSKNELTEEDMILSYGKKKKIILGATRVRISNGNEHKIVLVPCTRHGQVGKIMKELGYPPLGVERDGVKWTKIFEGFLTRDEALSREEARELAIKNGQAIAENLEYRDILFSEDLW